MCDILGYDCDGREIYEYIVLRAIWSNDIDIEDLDGADPRQYCAVLADDGNAYAISVYDWWNKDLIRKRENIESSEEIPIIVKPISEMKNYEVAESSEGDFCYDLDRFDLKRKLNSIIEEKNRKILIMSDNTNMEDKF